MKSAVRTVRLAAVVLMLVLGAVLLSSCKGGDETIKIGAAGPFTGDLSKIGLDSLNAVKMAVDEFNEAGGLGGRKVEVVVGDDGGDPSKGILVADKFGADKSILAVVGPMNSSVTNAALPAYEKSGLVLLSQSSTTSDLTDHGYKVMHRLCPRDDSQGKAAATFIAQELLLNRVYILDDKSTYGQGLCDEVEASLLELGVTDTKRDQVGDKDKDFSSLVALVKEFNPDLVYMGFANPSQAANLARQIAAAGLSPTFMGGDGCRERDQLIGGGGSAVQGMYVTTIGRDVTDVPEAEAFVEKFEAKHGSLSIFSGQSYEATRVVLAALEKASKAGKLDRESVLSALHDTEDYVGILGFPIGFDEKGDVRGGEIFVLTVRGDDFSAVKQYRTEDVK